MARYKVLVGLDYSGKRADTGMIVDDLPAKSIKWLREQGMIVLVSGKEDIVEDVEEEVAATVEESAAPVEEISPEVAEEE
jgi:hypothetical protein